MSSLTVINSCHLNYERKRFEKTLSTEVGSESYFKNYYQMGTFDF